MTERICIRLDELLKSTEEKLRIPELVSDNPMEVECPSCRHQWAGLHQAKVKARSITSSVAAIPIEKNEGYRCISDDNAVWLSGGFHVDTLIPSKSLYTLSGRNRRTWEKVVDFCHGRYFHAVAIFNGVIVVAGGYSYDKVLASVELYDTKSDTLKRGADMPQGVGNAAYCSHKGELFVCCGQYSEQGVYTSDKLVKYSNGALT